ncbi:MAG: hypothetical protein ACM309_00625 [Bacillota bacterium]
MRRLIAGVFAVFLCVCVTGCFGLTRSSRYTIIMQHDWSVPASAKLAARPVTPSEDLGHVIADDPLWETNGWYAWVTVKDEAGNVIDKPAVEWTTDIPECIRIVYYMPDGRTDLVLVTAFPGSAIGKGKLYAKCGDATASMAVVAYGPQFELTVSSGSPESEGWSRTRGIVLDRSEADFWIGASPDGPARVIKAPYGIRWLGDSSYFGEWGFFEHFPAPSNDGFVTELPPALGIYEVIGQDGVHYKVGAYGHASGSAGIDWYSTTMFTWAPFW